MFGILRFILATIFIYLHLTDNELLFPYGYASLFGFYIMSGYLMTYGLNRNYGFSASGSKNFWANRLLRIIPIYYMVFFITLPLILSFPGRVGKFHYAMAYSLRPIDWIGNLTLVPFTFYDMRFRVVPPSWSVGVEIACYIVLWLFIAKSQRNAIITGVLSILFAIGTAIFNLSFSWRYQSVPASLLPFALGALVYFNHDKLKAWIEPRKTWVTIALLAFLLINPMPYLTPDLYRYQIGFYLNTLAMTGLVAVLTMTKVTSPFLKKTDQLLGDLTYPMFLVQWTVAFLVYLNVPGLAVRGYPIFTISYPLIILVSLVIVFLVDRPLQRLRDRFRPHKIAAPAPASATPEAASP